MAVDMHEWLYCWRSAAAAAKVHNWPVAVALLERCAELRPDWSKGHANLARAREKLGSSGSAPADGPAGTAELS